jgi:multiple sugar transport system ATP-binding protein
MDEPLSNLDAKLRVQMRAEIARLQRSLGVTTIYVTHDQTEAMTLGSRVAVIRLGELQQVAPPQELYLRPANLFVASFIGSPAMNLIEASLERGDGGPHACFGTHRLAVPEKTVREHPGLERHLGKKVVLGIRPEHLEDASLARDPSPGSVIDVSVELREELGSEVDLHCSVGVAPLHPVVFTDGEMGDDAALASAAGTAEAARAAAAGAAGATATGATGTAGAAAAGTAGVAGVTGADGAAAASRDRVTDPSGSLAPAGAAGTVPSALAATIVARMDPRTKLQVGDRARVQVDLGALHFFDPETGANLRA